MFNNNNSPATLATLEPVTLTPARIRRFPTSTAVKLAVLSAPFALAGSAFAQTSEVDTLASQASGGAGKITAAVATLAGIALTIGLIIWAAGKLKPRH